MSMNFHIEARGKVIYPSGVTEEYFEKFDCIQTPSKVTEEIFATKSGNFIKAYKKWVLNWDRSYEEDIIDMNEWDEKTQYYKVVGKKWVYPQKDHCRKLDKFIRKAKRRGLTIHCYSM